jgi:hypothetical protein
MVRVESPSRFRLLLLDHFVGASNQCRRQIEVERLGGLKVDDEFERGPEGLSPFGTRAT